MPKVIKLKKGLDISLVGEALSELNELPLQLIVGSVRCV